MHQVSVVNLGGWNVNVSNHQYELRKDKVKTLESWLTTQWLPVAKQDVYVNQNPRKEVVEKYGSPSLFVRIDWLEQADPLAGICEVEDVIGGMGLFMRLCHKGKAGLVRMLSLAAIKKLPIVFSHVEGYRSDMEHFCDELQYAGIKSSFLSVQDTLRVNNSSDIFFFVADAEAKQLCKIARGKGIHPAGIDRLSKKLMAQANPDYNTIVSRDTFSLDASKNGNGVVLKSSKDWGTRGVVLIPGDNYSRNVRKKGDSVKKIDEFLVQNNEFLQQEFCLPPARMIGGEEKNVICRLWFGFDVKTQQFHYLDGLWVARASLKLHGASDSLSGNIIVR